MGALPRQQSSDRAIENHYVFVATRKQQARLKRRGLGQPPEDESDTGSTNDEDDIGASGGEDDGDGRSKPSRRKIKLGRKFVGAP